MRTTRMRAPTSNGFVLAILGALLTAGGVERGGCQAKPPTLKAVRDLRIDTALTNPARVPVVLPRPTGERVVAPLGSQGALRRFDSTGHGLPGSVAITCSGLRPLICASRLVMTRCASTGTASSWRSSGIT